MKKPKYETPPNWICPHCGESAKIVPDLSDFDNQYGTHYPNGWGHPICSYCDGVIEDAEELPVDFDCHGEPI